MTVNNLFYPLNYRVKTGKSGEERIYRLYVSEEQLPDPLNFVSFYVTDEDGKKYFGTYSYQARTHQLNVIAPVNYKKGSLIATFKTVSDDVEVTSYGVAQVSGVTPLLDFYVPYKICRKGTTTCKGYGLYVDTNDLEL